MLARIATGGMGEIFLARLEGAGGFEKLYVIKRILPHLANDPRFRAMLIAEARVAANMSHSNICHVYELDETDHQLYIVMEYLEGITLLALLRKYSRDKRQLDFGLIGGVIHQVAAGLHYAHELRNRDGELLGIVHRDVTPSNVFLTEGGVAKVHDFGVAKMKDVSSTESGTVKGKFAYMAPEQLQGTEVDRRVDVFALGVVIAEMLTGRRLFQRKTDYLTFRAVMEHPLPDFKRLRPDMSDAMNAVLLRALARHPEDRFATVRQLDAALAETIKNPWGQPEISELVHTDFADEIRRHNQEISSVVSRSSSSVRTMPIILQSPSDPDAEDYFAFETSVEVEPAIRRSTEPTSMRQPWWPIATVIGGAAAVLAIGLVLLRPPGQGDRAPAAPPSVVSPVSEPYRAAIQTRDSDLATCAANHDDPLSDGTRLVMVIGVDGRPERVTFSPETAGLTQLGTCIRNVMMTTAFPAQSDEKELALALRR